jgi:hypothetical protein
LWEKTTAHSQNILHVDVLYNIKRKKYKTSYPQFITLEASTLTITLPMRFPIFILFLLNFVINFFYCPSIYYLKTKINPKQNVSLRRKSKDWLARNQNNVSDCSDILRKVSTHWLLLAHFAKGNVNFYHHLAPVVRASILDYPHFICISFRQFACYIYIILWAQYRCLCIFTFNIHLLVSAIY